MLRTRIITALCLLAGLLVTLFLLPEVSAAAVFSAIAALAAWEWAGLLQAGTTARKLFAAATLLLCAALYVSGMPQTLLLTLWLSASLLWLLLAPLWLVRKWPLTANTTGFLIGWLMLLPCWSAMLALHARSPLLLLAAMAGGQGAASAYAQETAAQASTGQTVRSQEIMALRRQYVEEVQFLAGKAETMRLAGAGQEEIARTLHADRRALGVKYKNLTPPKELAEIYIRNEKKYGDKLGPTVDWLRQQGKSWESIIASASRTGGKDLGL